MYSEERAARVDRFMTGVKWTLAVLGMMAVASFIVTIASIADSRRRTIDAISDLRKQVEVLKGQNHWSIQDRSELHQNYGEIREALKRLETPH